MKCPKCQFENPERMKFYGECGVREIWQPFPERNGHQVRSPIEGSCLFLTFYTGDIIIVEHMGDIDSCLSKEINGCLLERQAG